jgi:GNAT superfamily N-acetyltransferase
MSIYENYTTRDALKNDVSIINSLLEENFHPEETILKCFLSNNQKNLTDIDLKQIDEDQRNIIEAMILSFPCHVIVHKNSAKIIGVNIMIASENPKVHIENRSIDVYKAYPPKSKLLSHYFHLMNDMIDKAKLFIAFPEAKRALEFYAIAIDKNYRRKGLSIDLMKKGIEYARRNGYDLVFGLFTSPYSKRAAENVGMKKIMDIDLLDYRDSHGSLIFLDSAPHNIASVMATIIGTKK